MNVQRALDRLADRIVELSQLAVVRLPELLAAVIVVLIARLASVWLSKLAQGVTRRAGGPAGFAQFVGRVISITILMIGSIVALYALGLGPLVLSFVASLGIVGLILGFALQDIARQFASGALLLTLRPFDIGDEISVKDFQGVVVDVQLLITVLRSADGLEVLIPNVDVYTSPIVNHSRYGLQRGEIVLKLAATLDLEATQAHLIERVQSLPQVMTVPTPDLLWTVSSTEGADVQAHVRFWVDCRHAQLEQVRSTVLVALLEALRPTTE